MTRDPNAPDAFVRPVERGDLEAVCCDLRRPDRDEAIALGLDPVKAVIQSAASSEILLTIDHLGSPIGLFGVVPSNMDQSEYGRTGCIWMVGTPGIERISGTFLRECRGWVDGLNLKYPILWNKVYALNTVHIRWLKWLDFKIISLESAGPKKEPFYQFIRVNTHVRI
jgi:hypothetical protein